MKVCFQIQRQVAGRSPWVETFELEASPSSTILDCLNQIKWEQDGSLAFRRNCRNTICGSCAMRVNGLYGHVRRNDALVKLNHFLVGVDFLRRSKS